MRRKSLRAIRWGDYVKSVALIAAVSILGSLLEHSIAAANIVMLYILVVVVTAVRWGKGPSILAAALSVLVFDVFFVPPHFSLNVADYQYLIAFATLFMVGLVVSTLTVRTRDQADAARKSEAQTAALYSLSRDLAGAADSGTVCLAALPHLRQAFGAEPAILLSAGSAPHGKAAHFGFRPTEKEASTLKAAMGTPPGPGAGRVLTFPTSGYCVPMTTRTSVIGVVALRAPGTEQTQETDRAAAPEQLRLLETCANLIASTLDRVRLAEEAGQARVLRETEKLQTAFLNSVSHDLRTPLVSVTGSLSSVLQDTEMEEESRKALLETAYEQSCRLNRLVSDLLDMARVDAGALRLRRVPADVSDLIGAAIRQTEDALGGLPLNLDVPEGLPEASVDFSLMLRVLANLLDNAVRYSPAGTKVDVRARVKEGRLELSVADRGIGIPAGDLEQVFNKFYRVRRPQTHKGTGLGLSVCKGIVEAHGGTISAANRDGGGTVVTVTVPLEAKG
ncbi:MAG: DUF4118 domain-containing protein [Candidatus Eisenbacteria bacterium]|nr:DUF4118 domain-containing protein [Candidatus Eisenbacteria bacterium]